jgi:hypothetical protein
VPDRRRHRARGRAPRAGRVPGGRLQLSRRGHARWAVAIVAFAAAGSLAAAPARPDGPPAVAPQPTVGEAAPPQAPREEFGWQVLVADGAGIVTTIVAATATDSWLVVAPYLAASPTVHLAHGDIKGAAGGLLLHAFLPLIGGFIGYQADSGSCARDELTCGFWGVALGTLAGVSLASALDATFLSSVERPVPGSSKGALRATPSLAVDATGRLSLSLAGRF